MSRLDFLRQKAPDNYVAGIGRGATGFTTRSDIGPAREGPSEQALVAAIGRQLKATQGQVEDDEDNIIDEVGMLASSEWQDQEDDEADRIYDAVEAKLDKRRATAKMERTRKEREEYARKNPTIQEQFADAKRALATVTDDEWANLPEPGDLTGKNKRRPNLRERTYAVSDSVILSSLNSIQYNQSVDVMSDGTETGVDGGKADFLEMGMVRDRLLDSSLATARDGTQTTLGGNSVDPKGYMTSLATQRNVSQIAQTGDLKHLRQVYESFTKSNPNQPNGWLSLARCEELAGKTVKAREVIRMGCEKCPKDEDLWIEAVRLNSIENGKRICAEAISFLPKSVKIWLKAMELETDKDAKKQVLRKALENVPQSVQLWKEAVNLEEDPNDAKTLLARATELIPLSVELWLALARLETYQNARKVLNNARKAVRTSAEIWVAAIRLEEQQGNDTRLDALMSRALSELDEFGGALTREKWIEEAEKCEQEGAILTCQAIIKSTLGMGIDDEDRKRVWLDDAESAIAKGCYDTGRAIYAYALRVFPQKKGIWRRAAELEKAHGSKETVNDLLEKAVESCPHAEVLWLMYAKEKWLANDVTSARKVLERAFAQNPNNEDIWLAAVKVEAENGESEAARMLLERARQEAKTERVWKKSVVLERELGDNQRALGLVNQALAIYPKFDKLWMMKGQIFEDLGKVVGAREAYSNGIKNCPKSIPLWILAARLEVKASVVGKARTILDQGRLRNPKDPQLWAESIRIEINAKNDHHAKNLLAKALQECPTSGLIQSEALWMEPRPTRRMRAVEGLKKADRDPVMTTSVARLFWIDRKEDKGRSWFEKALTIDPDYGDAWAWYYRLETSDENKEEIMNRCIAADPHHGEKWQEVAKMPVNTRRKTDEILQLVAASLV
jgi:pre-mRNA-processing factor 6